MPPRRFDIPDDGNVKCVAERIIIECCFTVRTYERVVRCSSWKLASMTNVLMEKGNVLIMFDVVVNRQVMTINRKSQFENAA